MLLKILLTVLVVLVGLVSAVYYARLFFGTWRAGLARLDRKGILGRYMPAIAKKAESSERSRPPWRDFLVGGCLAAIAFFSCGVTAVIWTAESDVKEFLLGLLFLSLLMFFPSAQLLAGNYWLLGLLEPWYLRKRKSQPSTDASVEGQEEAVELEAAEHREV